jgi:hypothetical protein
MSVVEFIGFIASFLVMLVLLARRRIEERRMRNNPELHAEQEKRRETLDRFLKGLEGDMNDGWNPSPPPINKQPKKPRPQKQPSLLPPAVGLHREMTFKPVDNAYIIKSKDVQSRAAKLIRKQGNMRDFIIMTEIINKPKGLR